ncbi:hypothetical protein OQ968_12070 [Mycobacterium sp. 663a-19]|uniref:hypothetical protein n=1 Tax=Mycobacterium sp. 663a-19 TaxID=2986148 RepID=UPI002D1ECEB8|nr:hypothetical protein [Mycobacterium sp. 663a-19]MEB3982001.1 hypothetical protein [Mycobacterium sp. 663a-19]
MDVSRVGSLFIRALEPMLHGDDMALVLKFRDNYDPDRLWAAYESLVRQNPALQVVLRSSGESFSWAPIDSAEVDAALGRQRERFFSRLFSFEELLSPANALTPPLPLRISRMNDRETCFQISHALSNGRAAIQWILYWLAAAHGEPVAVESVDIDQTAGPSKSTAPRSGFALLPLYIFGYLARAGRKQARTTVDLTHGKTPVPHDNGYASRTYFYSEQETDRILAKAGAVDLSLQQYMCLTVAEAMLAAQPEKSRVTIGIPTDLARFLPDLPRAALGNYTGSMVVQLRRGAPMQEQIARQFGWLRRGVDYWLARQGAASSNEQRLLNTMARIASLPVNRRGPFQNISCVVSNVGVVTTPANWGIESSYGTTKTQTIFFLVAVVNGILSVNVTFARDLYDPKEVFSVADAALADLGR